MTRLAGAFSSKARMATYDVIVIGAGIVGAACAHSLANAGQRVLVLDARLGGSKNSFQAVVAYVATAFLLA